MAYCVNCGVKLATSEKKCPLCFTPIYHPNLEDKLSEEPYSSNIETFNQIDKKFLADLICISLIIIGLISIFCNLIISKEVSWSVYVMVSILYSCSFLIFLVNKNIYISFICQLFSLEIFLLVIAYLTSGLHWYIYLLMPFIIIFYGYMLLCTYLVKDKKHNFLKKLSFYFCFTVITLIIIESGIDLYCDDVIKLTWSLYASLPIAIISLLLFIISFNKKILDQIKRRIFI